MTFWRAAGEERRVPDRAEDAKASGARHEEAEPIEPVPDILFAITKRDYGDSGVFDGTQLRFERRIESGEKLAGNVGGRSQDQSSGGDGFASLFAFQLDMERTVVWGGNSYSACFGKQSSAEFTRQRAD